MPHRALLVQLSDPHLSVNDPSRAESFRLAIAHAAALQPTPVAVVVTGDIADSGHAEEYAEAVRLLSELELPVHIISGNHDDRAALRAAFGLAGDPTDPIQFAVDAGPVRVIGCDTTIPGEDSGRLDVPWVEAQLAAEPGRPTVLALHHPPLPIGVIALDDLGLRPEDRASLAALVERSPQVLAVVAGHVHRAAFGMLGGVPVVTAPSTGKQLHLDFVTDVLAVNDDPPGFVVHLITPDGLVSHVQMT